MSTWGLHPCLVFLKDCSASKAEVDLSRTVRQNKESRLSNARACACATKLFKQSIFELFSAFFRPYCACLILFLCFPLRSNEPTSHRAIRAIRAEPEPEPEHTSMSRVLILSHSSGFATSLTIQMEKVVKQALSSKPSSSSCFTACYFLGVPAAKGTVIE